MSEKIPLISNQEFRDVGYLQEVNRQFLHPLGLALALDANYENLQIWDYRDDPEGIIFVHGLLKQAKADRVHAEREKKAAVRARKLGFIIQPIVED